MTWITGLMTGKTKMIGRNETMNKSTIDKKSPDYKNGYFAGYKAATKATGRKVEPKVSHWVMRKDGWYCFNCGTKYEQAHDNYCCKCGRKMSEEAY